MAKFLHEIRDPIHIFIHVDTDERKALDCPPLQRLRHIHQLATTHLLYPGATHRRFEHSLGVMELASRVYDVVTEPSNIHHESIRELIPQKYDREYWRRVIRMAALFHDVGHLPFSHAAEKDLLPVGWDHERLTIEIITSDELKPIWDDLKINSKDVAKIAVGPEYYKADAFSDLDAILTEIITGDSFGVDRMDYLLRDSHHTGVAYGKFDHYRLIDTLRILPKEYEDGSAEPALGLEEGGLHSAEALLLARFFMQTQLYFHHIRRIYDIHLKDFLKEWLPSGYFPTEIDKHLQTTDNEVTAAMFEAAGNTTLPGHEPALRIISRRHYKLLYEKNPYDARKNPESGKAIFEAACDKFGEEKVRHDSYPEKGSGGGPNFPVRQRDNRIVSSLAKSKILNNIEPVSVDYVFIDPDHQKDAIQWKTENLETLITPKEEEDS